MSLNVGVYGQPPTTHPHTHGNFHISTFDGLRWPYALSTFHAS
jgi:hypothetical protein